MSAFADRAFQRLAQFNGALTVFVDAVKSTAPDGSSRPKGALEKLLDAAARARSAGDAITRSFTLIEITALDIVDMQVRLQGETAKLASALRALGSGVEEHEAIKKDLEDELVALDEAAQLVASAVFPTAVQGLRDVNVKLWDFEKIQWKIYTDILTEVVQRNSITADQQQRIQAIADDVAAAFAEVNALLNDLAESRAADATALNARLKAAPERLTAALEHASARLAASEQKTLAVFGPVIKASKDVAEDVAKLLRKLTIPIYPTHAGLGSCCDFVAVDLYDGLGGVQAFALLNILSRMQATTASGRPLLDNRTLRVIQVFPDRIYVEADRSLIADVDSDSAFAKAPASMHRFKEGSYKQRDSRKGQLQLSYATRPGDRVVIDADIDLYRGVVPHLFGEVLVNHLTGNTTDQFKVRGILDDQAVPSIGGFHLLRPHA